MNRKLLLMGGFGPLPSERKHPQAQYKSAGGELSHYGYNNELFEFDPQSGAKMFLVLSTYLC